MITTSAELSGLVDNLPEPIAARDPLDFAHFDEVSTKDLVAILQET